jgi:hypothetical protein
MPNELVRSVRWNSTSGDDGKEWTMGEAMAVDPSMAQMPRGGPNASWLDRRLQTDALEYTDRYDIPDEVK